MDPNVNKTSGTPAAEAAVTQEKGLVMSREDLQLLEHKIQTGEIDKLPNGLTPQEQFEANLKLQEQQQIDREAAVKSPFQPIGQAANPQVEVRMAPNGVIMSSLAPVEAQPDTPPSNTAPQFEDTGNAPAGGQQAPVSDGHDAEKKDEEEEA